MLCAAFCNFKFIIKQFERRGMKETLADKPLDFENLRSPANAAPDWLCLSNDIDMCRTKVCFILRGHVRYVTRILISCGCCIIVCSARFALRCKSIFFNFFWNAKLFLRLYKGFTPFNLSPSVSWIWITKSDFLLSGNAMVSCNVLSRWTQLVSVSFFGGMLNFLG